MKISRTLVGMLLALLLGTACAQGLVVNEIDYDQPSSDTAEFIELKSLSGSTINLSTIELNFINGSDGSSYGTISLPDVDLPPGSYYVVCADTATVANCDLEGLGALQYGAIQNGGPDGVELLDGGAVVDAVTYEGDIPGVTEGSGEGLEDTGDGSIARTPNGTDTDQNDVDFRFQTTVTPGAANPEPVPAVALGIHDVQGGGFDSPEAGNVVIVEGVVTADFQADDELGGFYVQEEDADADTDAATSEGIFVHASTTDVSVGDLVQVTGTVEEAYGFTRLANVEGIDVLSSGEPLPAATDVGLPVTGDAELEAVEGMRVAFPGTLIVTETYNLGRYGEISLSADGRLPHPTNVAEPGAAAVAQAEENDRSRILLDDASDVQNPEPAPFGLTSTDTIRGGDAVTGLTGVVGYGFSAYRLQPTEPVAFEEANPRPAAPPSVVGDVRVASFNVLNYFATLDTGTPACGPAGNQDCRGANTSEELERQRAKILEALVELDADVLGLLEIENDEGASAQDLVDGLNAEFGAGTYAAIETGTIGTDAIKVALLYKPATVAPAGSFEVFDSSDDADFVDTKNRPVLIQSFDHAASGERFTVAVNHLKSKGSDCEDLGDPDQGDEQGNCNATRTAAAEALADFLATDPTGSGDEDVLIIGDLNAYLQEDPIDAIEAAGYVNLVQEQLGSDAYTYVFDGEWGVLDHALATPELAARADVAIWHINADEPRVYDYQTEYNPAELYSPTPYRSSDHDPVLIGLDFGAADADLIASLPAGVDAGETITVTLGEDRVVAFRARLSVPASGDAASVRSATFGLAEVETNEAVDIDRFRGVDVVLDANANGEVDDGEAVLGRDASLEDGRLVVAFDEALEVGSGESVELLLVLDLGAPRASAGAGFGTGAPLGAALALLASPLGLVRRDRRAVRVGFALVGVLLLSACGTRPAPTPTSVTVQPTLEAVDATSGEAAATIDGLPLEGPQLTIER